MDMETIVRITFTIFVVAMILLPLPPSTIIGVALATHPKTGKYMDQRAYRAVQSVMRAIKMAFVGPAMIIAERRMESARIRIETRTHRL
jgi:hypothetical protein